MCMDFFSKTKIPSGIWKTVFLSLLLSQRVNKIWKKRLVVLKTGQAIFFVFAMQPFKGNCGLRGSINNILEYSHTNTKIRLFLSLSSKIHVIFIERSSVLCIC